MEENLIQKDNWYRGTDLMNTQKKLLYQKLLDEIRKQQWEIAYFLDQKEKKSEEWRKYIKELEVLKVWNITPERQLRLKEKIQYITQVQWDILKSLQPLYHELFYQVADKIQPGIEYNKELKDDIWFDMIFGEQDIVSTVDGWRDNYWMESTYKWNEEREQKKIKKREEQMKKAKEKVWLSADHKLISNDNYLSIVPKLIRNIEKNIFLYMQKLSIDKQDTILQKKFVQKKFLYLFMRALIEEKLVFDMKSTKAKKCLDGTIETMFSYFWKKYWEFPITLLDFKRKLRHNQKSDIDPLDLSYMNALLDDIEYREEYLNSTYFVPQNISINDVRKSIMQEYNEGVGLIEKSFELLNPWYYIYKDNVEKHTKHLTILKEYQKKRSEADKHIDTIIEELQEKIAFAQVKQKEHTKLEDKMIKGSSMSTYSLTAIQQQYLKRYKVPIQYWHIFGIVINKINNFYQIKTNIAKKSDKMNQELFQRLVYSDRTMSDFSYYLQNYITFSRMDEVFDKEWSKKRNERQLQVKNICLHGDKIRKENTIKKIKKTNYIPPEQWMLDL